MRLPDFRKHFWIWLALLFSTLAFGLWGFRHLGMRASIVSPPMVSTAGVDRAVTSLITQAREEIRVAPRSGAAWGKLGMIFQAADLKAEARSSFVEAARLDPKEPRWPYFQGVLAEEEPEAALANFRRAVELCGDLPDTPRLRLAQVAAEQGRFDEAERHFTDLLRKQPAHAAALLGLAKIRSAAGRFEESANYARQALEDTHTAKSAYLLLSTLQKRLGNEPAAETSARIAATLPLDAPWPDPWLLEVSKYEVREQVLVDHSAQLLREGRIEEASPLVARILTDHPESAEGWLLLGRLRQKQKDCPGAEQAIREHLRLNPASANGYLHLGLALLCQQRFNEAGESFQKALKFKPDLAPAHFNLGFAYQRMGQRPQALESFRQAIRYNPDFIESYIALADLLRQDGQINEARAQLRRALQLNPSDPRPQNFLDQLLDK